VAFVSATKAGLILTTLVLLLQTSHLV